MSIEWAKDEERSHVETAKVDGGELRVEVLKIDRIWGPESVRWWFAPTVVTDKSATVDGAKAAAIDAFRSRSPVEWVTDTHGLYESRVVAVTDGCLLRLHQVKAYRNTSNKVSNEQQDGWNWSTRRDGVTVADGWAKELDEAKTAALIAAREAAK